MSNLLTSSPFPRLNQGTWLRTNGLLFHKAFTADIHLLIPSLHSPFVSAQGEVVLE
ncbi:MAG TPA: hypothetical protein VNN20_08550 [Thermodesulfobacteriota bacterium]|nr:hypothetical protein [Thermodesulfobacteriota bacterium]